MGSEDNAPGVVSGAADILEELSSPTKGTQDAAHKLEEILVVLRRIEAHLSLVTGERITEQDITQ